MFDVTDEYKSDIYALSRRVLARVTFDISPLDIAGDTPTITTSSAFELSNKNQLDDDIRESTFNLSTWETNRTSLDGSFTFTSDNASQYGQVGYVSSQLSDDNGDFASPITITFTYTGTYSSSGVTVTFDTKRNEYATDFTIEVFGQSNQLIHTETYTNNTQSIAALILPLNDFQKITIQINKWSHPEHRARVMEVDPGAFLVYENDKLIKMSSTEEIDPISASIVIPEFEFTVDNTTKEFDMFNPSGIYLNLEQRQQIKPELGLELAGRIEWIPLGVYLLSEWKSDTGSMTATFKGRSRLDLLDNEYYERTTAGSNLNIYDVMETILQSASIAPYYIDDALKLVPTTGILSRRTCREALQYAAMAGCATIRVKDTNVISIETARASTSMDTITFDELIDEPSIQLEKPTKKVTIFYFDQNGNKVDSVTATNNAEVGEQVSLDNNTLISSQARAQVVADWILARRSERKKLTAKFRGNPAHEIYDLVTVENRYISNLNAYLTKIQIEYDGFLSASIEGRTS